MSRGVIFGILLLLAALGGIGYALYDETAQRETTSGTVRLSDITLGIPDGAIPADGGVPSRLKQEARYTTADQLALRFVAEVVGGVPGAVSVRLIDDHGTIQPLQPDRIPIRPGMSGYCCWIIPKPGTYHLQIFRPEGGITSLPLEITDP